MMSLFQIIGLSHSLFNVTCTPHNSYITSCTNSDSMVPLWSLCDDVTSYNYAAYLNNLLQDVVIQYDALFVNSSDKSCLPLIDKLYEDIQCISTAIDEVIPKRKRPLSSFNVPGWNTYV
jgi:hypothetical protein